MLQRAHLRRAATSAWLAALALVAQETPVVARSGTAPLAEESGIPWFLLLTPEVITALLIAVGIFLLLALVVALVIYGSLRRSGRWDRAMLLIRSRYDDGPRAELASLRLRLLEALAGGRRAVELNAAGGSLGGELAGLQRRLQRLAVPLDGQLQLLQSEPDEASFRRMLAPAHARVREFELVARRLRETASLQFESEVAGELPELGAAADGELVALRSGVEALEKLTAGASELLLPAAANERTPSQRKENAP